MIGSTLVLLFPLVLTNFPSDMVCNTPPPPKEPLIQKSQAVMVPRPSPPSVSRFTPEIGIGAKYGLSWHTSARQLGGLNYGFDWSVLWRPLPLFSILIHLDFLQRQTTHLFQSGNSAPGIIRQLGLTPMARFNYNIQGKGEIGFSLGFRSAVNLHSQINASNGIIYNYRPIVFPMALEGIVEMMGSVFLPPPAGRLEFFMNTHLPFMAEAKSPIYTNSVEHRSWLLMGGIRWYWDWRKKAVVLTPVPISPTIPPKATPTLATRVSGITPTPRATMNSIKTVTILPTGGTLHPKTNSNKNLPPPMLKLPPPIVPLKDIPLPPKPQIKQISYIDMTTQDIYFVVPVNEPDKLRLEIYYNKKLFGEVLIKQGQTVVKFTIKTDLQITHKGWSTRWKYYGKYGDLLDFAFLPPFTEKAVKELKLAKGYLLEVPLINRQTPDKEIAKYLAEAIQLLCQRGQEFMNGRKISLFLLIGKEALLEVFQNHTGLIEDMIQRCVPNPMGIEILPTYFDTADTLQMVVALDQN